MIKQTVMNAPFPPIILDESQTIFIKIFYFEIKEKQILDCFEKIIKQI